MELSAVSLMRSADEQIWCADLEVTRPSSDRSGRSFMVSAPLEVDTYQDSCSSQRRMPLHRRAVRPPRVLYFYLRDRDLTAALGKLERLSGLLRDGTSLFMAAGATHQAGCSMRCWNSEAEHTEATWSS